MIQIFPFKRFNTRKRIALLDTTSISFMQSLNSSGFEPEFVLKDYDLILIPNWILREASDSKSRIQYIQKMIDAGYPIYSIAEENYSVLVNGEEGNLYQIVLASVHQHAQLKSYLRRYVETRDPLDMEAYRSWVRKLYNNWPLPGGLLLSGRQKKKNAGEISITILAEIFSWYYPHIELLTIYSQDRDTHEFQITAEKELRPVFPAKSPVPVSYKTNDAILCQMYRCGKLSPEKITYLRNDMRSVTYSREQSDKSVILVTEQINNSSFINLIQDNSVHLIF